MLTMLNDRDCRFDTSTQVVLQVNVYCSRAKRLICFIILFFHSSRKQSLKWLRVKTSYKLTLLFLFTLGGFGSNRRAIYILGGVCSGVIIFEKYEVNYSLYEGTPRVGFRVVTLDEKQLHAVQTNTHELNHLKNGQVFLPPQVFLKLGTHWCHQVVKIHDNVNQRVACQEKAAITKS